MVIDMTKEQIRACMKEKRNALSAVEQAKMSTAIRNRLLQMPEFTESFDLFTYISFQSEIDTQNIIFQALQEMKRVYVPRMEKEPAGRRMHFYRIDQDTPLEPNRYGILEPVDPPEEPYKITRENQTRASLMLLPGLAFTASGDRIGYGGGYYDRYLENGREKHFIKVALAYDFQFVERIETEEYDVKADFIITPTKVISCGI